MSAGPIEFIEGLWNYGGNMSNIVISTVPAYELAP